MAAVEGRSPRIPHRHLSVTVAIPTRPGASAQTVIDSLAKIHPPSPVIEIIQVEGLNPSYQRNEAGKKAHGDILYLLDDDSSVPSDIFHHLLHHFEDHRVMAVGGPSLTPSTDSFLQKCFGWALGSPFGSYRSRSRYQTVGAVRQAGESELIGCNLAVRRKTFLDEGGLDHSLHPNEETDLLDRLLQRGHVLLYDPEAFIFRSQRTSMGDFILQMVTYGRGRVEQTLLHPSRIKPFYFVSLIFSLYVASLPFFSVNPWVLYPLALYLLLAYGESIRIAWMARDSRAILFMPVIFTVMHISHGCGLLWGFFRRIITGKTHPSPSDIRITFYRPDTSREPVPSHGQS